ncbi:MAG TPA: hypothetical protein VFO11_11020 [Candidatus Polarisedimenticolaceae bacterium]|nr:hypothetical protein [Candidatus Polarisedimenticolaceae bacterium]
MPHQRSTDRERQTVRSFLMGMSAADREHTPAQMLERLLDKAPQPGAALAWALARDPDATVREFASALLLVAAHDPAVSRRVRRPILRAAGTVLERALHDPEVDDEVKFRIGPALSLCGIEVDDAAYRSAFRDHAGTSRRMMEEAFRGKETTPEAVDAWLETMELPDPASFAIALDLCRAAVEVNAPLGAMLLVCLAARSLESGIEGERAEMLRLAASTHSGEARWALRTFGELPSTGALGDLARALAVELQAAAIEESVPRTGPFEHGLVSMVDGAGSRQVALFFRGPEADGDRDALMLLPNDEVGIKDVFGVWAEGDEVLERFDAFASVAAVAPCDLALARALTADALATHARTGRPVPAGFLCLRPLLGPEPLLPLAREPDLSAYGLERLRVGPELVARSGNLAYRPDTQSLYCATDRAYQFVADRIRRSGEDDGLLALSRRELRRFLEEIAAEDGPRLLHRLAVNLEVQALAGRAKETGNKRLARLWWGLRHEVVPFADVPFVEELTRNGLGAIVENVLQGFLTQAEANEAELEASRLDEDGNP